LFRPASSITLPSFNKSADFPIELVMNNRVLLIDDDKDNLRLVTKLLEHEDLVVQQATSGVEGLQQLTEFRPDLVILDINMQGLNGFQTLKLIRQRNEQVSVMFLTSNRDTEDIIQGLEAGALDYICKPFQPLELIARVKSQLKFKGIQDDLRIANEKLQSLVDIDDLTGLYNMRSVYERLNQEIDRARRYKHSIAVFMMDMDDFKRVNDNHDHLFGSYVLSEVGKLIKSNIRSVDFAARYGGDEFLICLTQTDPMGAVRFADRLRKKIDAHEFISGPDRIQLSASFGAAILENGRSLLDAHSIVRLADAKLYEAKASGKNRVESAMVNEDTPFDIRRLRKAS
jgi:two-component system, cell cycle response regulator